MKTLSVVFLLPLAALAAAVPPRQRFARCLTSARITEVVTNAPAGVRVQVPDFYRFTWSSGASYRVGDVVTYSGAEYCCIQSHTVYDSGWTPAAVPALWRKLRTLGVAIPDWVQPTGAHDAYRLGEKVRFQGKVYQSIIDYNVWSPAVYPAGWKEV